MSTPGQCEECGAPATRRWCDRCLEAFARAEEDRLGLPPGGRDPDVVSRELRWRRAAAAFLHHRLTGDTDGQEVAMRLVLSECHAQPGLTPNALLLPTIVDLVNGYLRGMFRERFLEDLRGEMLRYANLAGPEPPPDTDDGGGAT